MKVPTAGCRLPVEKRNGRLLALSIAYCKSKITKGFTLIELLVVITIIAVLAAFTVPALRAVKRHQYISQTQAEMGQLETAIESYKSTYGFYPPDNPANPLVNQLYYELAGTTNNGVNYVSLDGSSSIGVNQVATAFPGVGGFVNCSKPGSGEDSSTGRDFLPELTTQQTGTYTANGVNVTLLIGSVAGPDADYEPLGVQDLNPWRYRSSGTLTNNPGGYELWIQLSIGRKTNLICNWNKTVQINSSLQ